MTGAGLRRPLEAWWRQSSFGVEAHGRRVAVLVGLGTLIGIGESAVVVLVIAIAAEGTGSTTLPLLGEPPGPAALVLMAVIAVGLLGTAHLVSARLIARFGAETQASIQKLLAGAFMHAPWQAQNAARAGHLQDLVTNNAGIVAYGSQQAATAVTTAINLLIVVGAALLVSVWTTLLLSLAMVVVLLVTLPFRSRTQQAARSAVATEATLALELTETSLAAREARVFGVVDAVSRRLDGHIDETARRQEAFNRLMLSAPPLTRAAALAVLMFVLAIVVQAADVSLPTLGVAAVLVLRALGHAQVLSGTAQALVERTAHLDLIQSRLTGWEVAAPRGTRGCARIGEIELRGVGHVYGAERRPALDEVSMTLRAGDMTGVVGRTGAGKSTLASIVLGLMVPSRGSVACDGVPLSEVDPADWHARTAWVAQEPRLLSGTVRENVRFLREWIDDAQVEAAVLAAGLGPELERWSGGIDHDVGPAGAALSGGERQRVALARAIAGQPALLVLDEPTSALDAHSEAAVRAALDALRGDTAIMVIAHRLSTVRTCDRVAVLDGGRLVALAPPQELERTNPWFRQAFELSGAA